MSRSFPERRGNAPDPRSGPLANGIPRLAGTSRDHSSNVTRRRRQAPYFVRSFQGGKYNDDKRTGVIERGAIPLAPLVLAALALGVPAAAQEPTAQPLPPMVVHADGEKAKFSGIIVTRSGDTLRLREGDVATHTIVSMTIHASRRRTVLFKMSRKKRDATSAGPGPHDAGRGTWRPRRHTRRR